MPSSQNPLDSRPYAILNAFVVALVLLGVFLGFNWHSMPEVGGFLAYRITIKNVLLAAVFLLASEFAFRVFGLAPSQRKTPSWRELLGITRACLVASVFALLFPLTTVSGAFTAWAVAVFLPIAIAACICGRFIVSILGVRLSHVFRRRRDLIIVGSGHRAEMLYQQVCQEQSGCTRVLGFVDDPDGRAVSDAIRRQILGGLEDLERILMRLPVDEVLIALPATSCYEQIQTTIAICERGGIEAKYYLSDVFHLSLARPRLDESYEQSPVVSLKVVHDDPRILVKRAIDIFGAAFGLIVFAPLMLMIAAAIKLTSAGPVLFIQERYGFRKRRFRMYKFRTMVADAEKLQAQLESRNEVMGPAFKIRHDPRVTPLGRILRKTSLDELPQLFNVLTGEMSLVGPRPLPGRDVSRFDDASLMRRFSVKPGLTCLWQINGRSNTDFKRWIELDLRYIDTWSLSLDLEIIVKTFPSVLAGRGAT